MKNIILIISVILISGCALHYRNQKGVTGQGKNINTPYGKVEGVKAGYQSTFDMWFPWKFNEAR